MNAINQVNQTISREMTYVQLLQGWQIYQNQKITKSLEQLREEQKKQTEIIEKGQNAIVSVAEKQLRILEQEEQRKHVERATKQVIYEVRKRLEAIENMKSMFEKYISSIDAYNQIRSSGIEIQNLSDISDKEFFDDVLVQLNSVSQGALENLSNDELADLNSLGEIDRQSVKIQNLIAAIQSKEVEIARVKNLAGADRAGEFQNEKKAVTILSLKGCFFLIIVGVVLASLSKSSSDFYIMTGAISLAIGVIGIPYVIVRNVKRKASGYVGAIRNQSDAVKLLESEVSELRLQFKGITGSGLDGDVTNLVQPYYEALTIKRSKILEKYTALQSQP